MNTLSTLHVPFSLQVGLIAKAVSPRLAVLPLLALLAVVNFAAAQSLLNPVFPKTQQFFPRDDSDSASVTISGSLIGRGADSLKLLLFKNNTGLQTYILSPFIQHDTTRFALSIRIHAELANYRFELWSGAKRLITADSVVCGDAFFVDGQSNSLKFTGVIVKSSWTRTYSYTSGWQPISWEIGQTIADSAGIPTFVFNSGMSGMPIGTLFSEAPCLLAKAAGVDKHIKAMIWNQGEANQRFQNYDTLFMNLYNFMKQRFPAMRHAYTFQLRPNLYDTVSTYNNLRIAFREIQRQIPHRYPEIRILSGGGVPFNEIHYPTEGVTLLVRWLAPLILKDFYSLSDTSAIRAPDLQCAYFASSENREIVLLYDQPVIWPADTLGYSMKDYLYLDGMSGFIDSAWVPVSTNELHLRLRGSSSAKKITYLPASYYNGTNACYQGPWIRNRRGISALAFSDIPILKGATPSVTVLNARFSSDSLESDLAYPVSGTVEYSDGSSRDATSQLTCRNLTPAILRIVDGRTVVPIAPGKGIIVATYIDSSLTVANRSEDTLAFTVYAAAESSVLDSLVISPSTAGLHIGGFNTLSVTGYYSRSTGFFSRDLAPSVEWISSDTEKVRVDGRQFVGVAPGDLIPVIGALGEKRDTAFLTVVSAPDVMRINFQVLAASYKSGWLAENGQSYSDARGYGWTTGSGFLIRDNRNGTNFLLKSFVSASQESNFRIKVPDGRYVIRIGMGDNQNSGTKNWVRTGIDTLMLCYGLNWVSTNKVSVSNDSGLVLTVKGAINYIVLMADNGSDINSVSDDDYIGRTAEERQEEFDSSPQCTVYPNPFNPSVSISIFIGQAYAHDILINIFDVRGREVTSFRSLGRPGKSTYVWNAHSCASGLYFARIRAGSAEWSKALMLIR